MTHLYRSAFYEFAERPLSDSCWSLSTGPDGRIYAAACTECTPGQTATLVRYDEENDRVEYLLDLDRAVGDLRDSGRATQCKIHYSFAPSPRDGILYMATHLSGAPAGDRAYCTWKSWYEADKAFRGSALVAFDVRQDNILLLRSETPQSP
jgi:hypothetical protein